VKRPLLLLLLFLSLSAHSLENRLAGSLSPYLEMHAQDPVHWQPWSREVLEQAKREGKLIFVSSGYFACHWCHVMQRESYRNAEIARLLNEYFIPVKVDRELNPALDEHLIDFVQRTQGHAGWPLNVFLTPEGYPVTGTTYLPPERFQALLRKLHELWQGRREEITGLAERALEALVEARKGGAAATVVLSGARLRDRFLGAALELADEISGGFGQQNRFPMQPQLHALLLLAGGERGDEAESFLRLTLAQMAQRGLRDHLGGGFFRYTVDPQWTVPHYEKMLYTQALLALLYLEAADVVGEPGFRAIAFDTLDFVVREMKGEEGGYVASFSAVDGEGVEGGYYLWSRDEVASLFSPGELPLVLRHWHFEAWENGEALALPLAGEPLAALAKEAGVSTGEMAARVEGWRQRLLQARAQRILPVDHKRLAGWNGLLLAALAEAARAPGGDRFRQPASELARYLVRVHWKDGWLLRSPPGKGGEVVGSLEDYAYVAWGLNRWADAGGDAKVGRLSRKLVGEAWRLFHDEAGWHGASDALLPGMPASEAQEDGALPSPAAVVVALSLGSGEERLQEPARRALLAARPRVQAQPFWYASWVRQLVR